MADINLTMILIAMAILAFVYWYNSRRNRVQDRNFPNPNQDLDDSEMGPQPLDQV
jgi:hypothetical protein